MIHNEYHHLFIAIDIDIKLVERLTLVQNDLGKIINARGASVRWTAPENLHLSLKFLGSHDFALLPELCGYIDDAVRDFPSFSINTAFIGAFPHPDCPRIIYASTDQGLDKLQELRKRVDDVLALYQFVPDKRPYLPHITLGRVKTPLNALHFSDAINAIKDLNFGSSHITEVILYGSNLTSSGAYYTVLSRHPLRRKTKGA
ncbi:MAG: RNA 2',3'-cyclic phosphodiesterase [Bradymonadales bacterium]|jgi:2'-5' RNA ligase